MHNSGEWKLGSGSERCLGQQCSRFCLLLVVYYLFAEDLGHSGGVIVRQKNEPCHTIIIIIINLFMIIMAPIFPKRPPIGVLFDFLSWG